MLLVTLSVRAQQPSPPPASQQQQAHEPARDPIGESFIPPELLMQNQEEIGLSEEQRQSLQSELGKAHVRFGELQEQLQKENEALAALLKKDQADEAKALAQLEKVMEVERQMKRTHLGLAVAVKNQLTPEQQEKAQTMKAKWQERMAHAKPPPQSLQAKMQKFQAGVKKWEDQARDMSPVGELMQEFEPLMKEEKFKEAESVLDKALAVLGKDQ
jgi:Spy/CpxP family protein refolding chaperone